MQDMRELADESKPRNGETGLCPMRSRRAVEVLASGPCVRAIQTGRSKGNRDARQGVEGDRGMRRAAKVDANQAEIVAALRKVGATVQSLAATGSGVPDLLVGFRGNTFLIEVKDGRLPPSARELTPDQIEWHVEWRGGACTVVNSVGEALAFIGATA